MLQRVRKHNLTVICEQCSTTLRDLSAATDIDEEDLLAFSNGTLALSAAQRLDILSWLCECSAPADAPNTDDAVRRNTAAYTALCDELEQEARSALTAGGGSDNNADEQENEGD